jgi:radical SAM protein with 4Fe4S-binding SPASM domain
MAALGYELDADEILIKEMSDVDASLKVAPDQLERVRSQLRECMAEDVQSGRNRLRLDFGQHPELQQFVYQTYREWLGDDELSRRENVNPAAPRAEYCLMGWYSATIAATGKVYPCCVLHEREGKELGDVNAQSIGEIWRGEAYQNFRRQFRKVMLTRGEIAYDAKRMGCMDPICVGRYACYYTFKLATPEFYRRLAGGLDAQHVDRLMTRAGAGIIEAKRKLLAAVRAGGG